MSRLKIAHVTTVALSLRHLLLHQLQNLQSAGYDVAGISAPGPETQALVEAGIRHIPVPMTRAFTPLQDLRSLLLLLRVFRREGFCIVHTHTPKPGLLGQLAARLAGVPVVVNTLHGFYFHERTPRLQRRLYIQAERVAARCSDVILSQSSEDVESAVREGICDSAKIRPLGNGIDLGEFNAGRYSREMRCRKRLELGLPVDAFVIGFVGRLVAEKGVLELLEAARVVIDTAPQARLLLIGPTDKSKADAVDHEAAARLGIAPACVFTGLRHDMPELYHVMDLFVLPSHREGYPRSLMEASAMGVPCVATDVRGCREVVEHGGNGILVPPHDAGRLAGAILGLLGDPAAAREMGERGQQVAQARFDETRVFQTVRAEYSRLLVERGIQPPPEWSRDKIRPCDESGRRV